MDNQNERAILTGDDFISVVRYSCVIVDRRHLKDESGLLKSQVYATRRNKDGMRQGLKCIY